LAEACGELGVYWLEEVDLTPDATPEDLRRKRLRAVTHLREAIRASRALSAILDGDTRGVDPHVLFAADKARLLCGRLERAMARVEPDSRERWAESARDRFEDLMFCLGESLISLRAWFEYSRVAEVLGDHETALADHLDTVETLRSALEDAEDLRLGFEVELWLVRLLQEACERLAAVLHERGDVAAVIEIARGLRGDLAEYVARHLSEHGDPLDLAHPLHGHLVFLHEARALAATGDVERARALLCELIDRHPRDLVRIRAERSLRELSRRGR
jgi:hypothetical protein